jgi:hypothetical protein
LALLTLGPRAASPQPLAHEVAKLYTLVDNGGFEDGDALPTFWAAFPPKPETWGSHRRDTAVFHSGHASGLLVSEALRPSGKAGVQWNKYGIEVEGGSTLIASFWVKGDKGAPAGAGVHAYDAEKNHLGFTPIRVPGTAGEWTYVRQEVPLPQGAKTIGFPLYGKDESRTWFDDVALLGAPSTEAVRGTPTVDGKLDDACWQPERAISQFVLHTGAGLPKINPQAWLAYDDENLYVAFRCPHPAGATLKQQATRHDGDTWLDDSVEVFLDPWHGHREYYQFCVNCLGVIRDTHGTATQWESGARAKVQRAQAEWTAELAIPYAAIGLTLDTGETWGINLVRNDRANGETSTWSLGGFHNPGRFGNIALKPGLTRFLRADLETQLARKERERAAVLDELRAGELAPAQMAEPTKLLDEARESANRLRAVAQGKAAIPANGWDGVRRSLADISKTITTARQTALSSLFKVGDAEGDGGFRVAIAHSLQKVRRDGEVVEGMLTRRVRLAAARDETESFQLVVIPNGAPLTGVTVDARPLKGAGGEIPVEWKRVEYVETAPPGYPTEYVGWWPDPLYPAGPFDVAADRRQPLWFTVSVPPEAKPGVYRGEVVIRQAEHSVAVPVELTVRSFRLPRPGTLATAFGLYAQVLSRWYHGDRPYAEVMTPEQYLPWCEFLGRYRLAPKNLAQEFLGVTKTGDGSVTVDMSALRKLVTPLAPRYFAPYSCSLHRTPNGNGLGQDDGRTSASDAEVAAAAVRASADEWTRLGFPRQAHIYGYDEPRPEDYSFLREAYTKIHAAAPGYPIMQTIGDPRPDDLVGAVDIWCPLSSCLDSLFYAERLRAGDTLWTYTCCGPKHPYANFFIDRPATEHRVLFWQTRQYGATGFLYWCVCWWDGPPNADSGQPCFPAVPLHWADIGTYKSYKDNGDGWLLYPGPSFTPWPSIRLEVIRDGIEDYEYLALLSKLLARAKALPPNQRPPEALCTEAEELCRVPETISRGMTDYTTDPQAIFQRREAVGGMIDRLADVMNYRDAE